MSKHFRYSIRPVGTPIELCDQVPEGAVHVDEGTMDEVLSVRGAPLTAAQVYVLLASELHPDFPLVSMVSDGATLVFHPEARTKYFRNATLRALHQWMACARDA